MTTPELQRLKDDRVSGATILGDLAVTIVEHFLSTCPATTPRELATELERLSVEIMSAQPSMAVMLSLARRVLAATTDETSLLLMKERVTETLSDFRATSRKSLDALCQQALLNIPKRATVLTYSNSASVLAVLRHARIEGHLDRVLLSEARPAFDGRSPAASLASIGVQVDFYTDMALFAGMQQADVVLLGADAVFPTYFLNKVGTCALAELARVREVSCYAVSVEDKCLPSAAAKLLKITKHSCDEVWAGAPLGVQVHNDYFEEIPLSLLTGIVTDQGVWTPDDLETMLNGRDVPVALLRLARGRES